jgi:ubiquinone/menaquinone biosynthesis C-methylase UbiE
LKTHYVDIYAQEAERYHALVSREDHRGALLPALQRAADLDGARVLELGCGTGRLTRQLAPLAGELLALDGAAAMIQRARAVPELAHVRFAQADHRALPVPDHWADVVVEGWAFGHLLSGPDDAGRAQVRAALAEVERVLRPGGVVVLIETLGTGRTTPQPPSDALAGLYAWLTAVGFQHSWIRTDYEFADVEQAVALTGFFFGAELGARVSAEGSTRLPECTGLWWRASASG